MIGVCGEALVDLIPLGDTTYDARPGGSPANTAVALARLDEQIRELELLKTKLTSCIGCGCLSLRRCALSNPDDVVADQGPGAVYLRPADAP